MDNSLAAIPEVPIFLSEDIKKNLQTWEDYISYYTQLTEVSNSYSWIKADLLVAMANKWGEASIEKFSHDLGESASTVEAYIRTSNAFPVTSRSSMMSFSHHYQASFADKYDNSKSEFQGDKRFDWIGKAEDEHLSTRELARRIQEHKEKNIDEEAIAPKCDYCKEDARNGVKFVFYARQARIPATDFFLHPDCANVVVELIKTTHTK